MTGCLDSDELASMAAGTLSAERAEAVVAHHAVVAHLDQCAVCAEVVATLGAFDTPADRSIGRYRLDVVIACCARRVHSRR